MNTQMIRRDLFKFAGGGVAGLALTPVPYRLLTDAALWSQNWSWIPKPLRGEIRAKYTHCALCPAGCAVKARLVGEQPISLAGTGEQSGLCPFGLTAHHLPYHPARVRQALQAKAPVALEKVRESLAAAIAKRRDGESVAVLDSRPGRTASWMYRRALANVKNGVYVTPAAPPAAGIDLEKAKTVLSFGVPVLDGWASPGRVMALRGGFRLVQVEAVESRTAALADEWLPARPGSEVALALALLGQMAVDRAAEATGVDARRIEALRQSLTVGGPAVVLGPAAIADSLNAAFHAPLVPLNEVPVPKEWRKAAPVTLLEAVPDHSIAVLLIDESLPGDVLAWTAIAKKLVREGAVVASFTATPNGYARNADFVLPVAVPSEAVHDLSGTVDSPFASFRIAQALSPAPAGLADPVVVVDALCGAAPVEKALEQRAAAIHQAGRGRLLAYATGAVTPVKEVKAEDFWKALNEGGRWEDDPAKAPAVSAKVSPPAALPPMETADLPLAVVISAGVRGEATPLMTKLYQESGLRQSANQVALHPTTAREAGLEEGARVLLQTRCGRAEVRLRVDAGVMPGVVQVVAGPAILDLCDGPSARAKVVRV